MSAVKFLYQLIHLSRRLEFTYELMNLKNFSQALFIGNAMIWQVYRKVNLSYLLIHSSLFLMMIAMITSSSDWNFQSIISKNGSEKAFRENRKIMNRGR
ncbi:unnamed protein product [Litomosoides sigmodontis]|uniref:Uncharacterized protein n=1 Tax=Litomosoides sigmodontis TaxID=42156 RepID=A0A3P6UAK6_LITSI|nr:unnamed protein product [Litomosoides sigmodontis]